MKPAIRTPSAVLGGASRRVEATGTATGSSVAERNRASSNPRCTRYILPPVCLTCIVSHTRANLCSRAALLLCGRMCMCARLSVCASLFVRLCICATVCTCAHPTTVCVPIVYPPSPRPFGGFEKRVRPGDCTELMLQEEKERGRKKGRKGFEMS